MTGAASSREVDARVRRIIAVVFPGRRNRPVRVGPVVDAVNINPSTDLIDNTWGGITGYE
jgi:hypothetical protein